MCLERRGWIIRPDSEVNHFMGGTCEEGKAVRDFLKARVTDFLQK